MKISEVTITDLKEYANIDHDYDDKIFSNILLSSKAYIKSYTGLNQEQIDEKEELTIALMILCNEMYENRIYTVENDKVNKIVNSILDMHSINLL
ncbi:head-tail connector protein [uncultured Clostridium sp.]|uniref:head-tail connector protein n=1 Tax=uncultured Clostridium sp. TaxID=59620 RepID=UPI002630DC07|nr:head-tail connector protein [uncultured Clostridium sp.]